MFEAWPAPGAQIRPDCLQAPRKSSQTYRNSGTLPRPKGDLYQSPYRATTIGMADHSFLVCYSCKWPVPLRTSGGPENKLFENYHKNKSAVDQSPTNSSKIAGGEAAHYFSGIFKGLVNGRPIFEVIFKQFIFRPVRGP